MKKLIALIALCCLAIAPATVGAQSAGNLTGGIVADYARLAKATRFVENYKEMAAVAAKVLAARGKAKDKEYARFMRVISTADLSDISDCITEVYASQDLGVTDVNELIATFESPLGVKLLKNSQKKVLRDVERGSPSPMPLDTFSEQEKQAMAKLFKRPAFINYSRMVASREFTAGTTQCFKSTKAVKEGGFKF